MQEKKIKIALIIDKIDYLMGGTERQLLLLYDNFNQMKYQPYLVVLSDSPWCDSNKLNYNMQVFPSNRLGSITSWKNFLLMIRFFRDTAIDVAVVYFRDGTFIGIPCSVIAGIPIIISARRGLPYWKNLTELWYLRFLNRFVKGFLLNTHQLIGEITRFEKVNPDKMRVVYNGFNMSVVHLSAEEIGRRKSEWGFAVGVPVVVITANLRRVKRIDVFIDAAAKVIATGTQMGFIIIGSGELEGELRQQVNSLGLSKQVLFLGRRDDVREILPLVDIGVLCSDSEALPNAVIEYMAFGLPVVCTAVGGCLELVENNVNGFLVDVGSAERIAEYLLLLATDADLRKRFGEASIKKVSEQFSVNMVIRATEEYIETLVH